MLRFSASLALSIFGYRFMIDVLSYFGEMVSSVVFDVLDRYLIMRIKAWIHDVKNLTEHINKTKRCPYNG